MLVSNSTRYFDKYIFMCACTSCIIYIKFVVSITTQLPVQGFHTHRHNHTPKHIDLCKQIAMCKHSCLEELESYKIFDKE